jgi:hypothetical protein
MTSVCMPRDAHKFRLDDRIIAALKAAAEEQETSFNAYVEGILFAHAKVIGKIPADAQPLAETRGGKRPGTGRKSKADESPIDDSSDD